MAAALARVEGRELAASPWFATGIGFCTFMVLGFGLAGGTNQWRDVVEKLPFLAHPLVGVMVVASHWAATRARRDGAADLFEACPTAPVTRTVGVLGSALVPVLIEEGGKVAESAASSSSPPDRPVELLGADLGSEEDGALHPATVESHP